jgi:acyl-CoA reductase-like NAD-dependent aldehyde dehydrogenase
MSSTVTDVKAYQWYAGGQWRDVANGQLFDDFEPYTGNLYARVADCGAEEARLAIAAAHEAFGAWAETPPVEKARLFFHQGQICLNTRKIIIQRAIYDEFLDKFVARVKTLPSGDPLDPHTIIGPLVTQAAVDLMHKRVQEAVALGATVHTGGTSEGLVFQPTVLTDVPYTAEAANEETFGPLVLVDVVDTAEQFP